MAGRASCWFSDRVLVFLSHAFSDFACSRLLCVLWIVIQFWGLLWWFTSLDCTPKRPVAVRGIMLLVLLMLLLLAAAVVGMLVVVEFGDVFAFAHEDKWLLCCKLS